jgi:hypothetical protein
VALFLVAAESVGPQQAGVCVSRLLRGRQAVFVEAIVVCLIFGNAGSDPSRESFFSNMTTASGVRW